MQERVNEDSAVKIRPVDGSASSVVFNRESVAPCPRATRKLNERKFRRILWEN